MSRAELHRTPRPGVQRAAVGLAVVRLAVGRLASEQPTTVLLAAVLLTTGCHSEAPQQSPTRGRLVVAAADGYAALITREAQLFGSIYQQAQVEVRGMTTREAFVALLADSVSLIVVDRAANAEERAAFARPGRSIEELRLAEDALALVVHPSNPVQRLSHADAAALIHGQHTRWDELAPGLAPDAIELVLTGRNSGAWELLAAHFFAEQPPAPSIMVATQREALDYVAVHAMAIAAITVPAWRWSDGAVPDPRVRALAISDIDSTSTSTSTSDSASADAANAQRLVQANLHDGGYPLHFPVYAYVERSARLATGFSAFMASSPGQKLVQNAGLAPATLPVRIVQRD